MLHSQIRRTLLTGMCKSGYKGERHMREMLDATCWHRLRIHIDVQLGVGAYDFISYVLRHIYAHFWQVHQFEFQYKCVTENRLSPFCRRPG